MFLGHLFFSTEETFLANTTSLEKKLLRLNIHIQIDKF